MEDKRTRLIKKFLQSEEWKYDDLIYEFVDVTNEDGYLTFIVNVKTSIPNQSYVRDVLSHRIEEILETVSKYFGYTESTPFGGYVRKIYVNGKPSLNIYINGKKQEEILMALNNGAGKFELFDPKGRISSSGLKKIEMIIKYSFSNDRFLLEGDDISFFLTLDIYNLKIDDEYVKISDENFDYIKYEIYESFEYRDFYLDVSDLIWIVMQPEFKLNSESDLYITCSAKIRTINKFNG